MPITNATVNNAAISAIYTSSGVTACTVVYFCNTGATTRTLDVYCYPSGGSGTAATQIYKTVSLPAGETFVLDTEKIIFSNNDVLAAKVDSTTDVTATISSIAL